MGPQGPQGPGLTGEEVAALIQEHNTSGTAHPDLRVLTDDTDETANYKLGVENGLLYLQLQETEPEPEQGQDPAQEE